jgi:energy-coupling factor transport system ATP-binding protein
MILLKNVSFAYQDERLVINNLSLEIKKGSHTTIIGHNGSGKSTLAKLFAGLIIAKSGTVFVDKVALSDESLPQIRQKIGIVFQNPDNQFIGATVKDDIAFGLENRMIPRDKMDAIIHQFSLAVGMESFLDREPSTLSGGQKQRVAIAGVLAMAPEVLILDEATSMLDPQGKKEVRQFIQSLKTAHPELTIISITHDLEEASESEQIIVLDKGTIFAQGTPEDIFQNHQGLKSIHLDVPFIYALKAKLKIKDPSLNTLEKLANYLCQ